MAANNAVSDPNKYYKQSQLTSSQLDRVVGLAMLILASTVFLYYTVWTLLMVHTPFTLIHIVIPVTT